MARSFSTCSYRWRQHRRALRRWRWKPWRPRRCWNNFINYWFDYKTVRAMKKSGWYLLGGHVDFWGFKANFFCHFILFFDFYNLLKRLLIRWIIYTILCWVLFNNRWILLFWMQRLSIFVVTGTTAVWSRLSLCTFMVVGDETSLKTAEIRLE